MDATTPEVAAVDARLAGGRRCGLGCSFRVMIHSRQRGSLCPATAVRSGQPGSDKGLCRVKVTAARVVPDDGAEREADGDFAAFCQRERGPLEYWYTWSWGLSPEDAAEVAQDVFAAMFPLWTRHNDQEHRRASYYTVTRRKVVDFLRKRQRRIQPEVWLDDEETPDLAAAEPASNPAVIFGGNEGSDQLWEAVDELSEPCRVAVLGHVVVGLSYAELADATGRAPGTVRQDVARGLSFLRQMLRAPACVLAALASLASRVRRIRVERIPSATVATLAVVPQGMLLGLLFTSPLYVLPHREALGDVVRSLPRSVTALIPGPAGHGSRNLMVSSPPLPPAASAAGRAIPRLLRRVAPPVAAAVDSPDLCLRKRCGTGERITVSVLGHEQTLPGQNQNYVEVCWAFPKPAEPYVTCHRGSDPA